MTMLNELECEQVNGGMFLGFAVRVVEYVGYLDAARNFGAGLGRGFYDGEHGEEFRR